MVAAYRPSRPRGRVKLKNHVGQRPYTWFLISIRGSRGRIRTDDQLVNSELRYRCATRENKNMRLVGTKNILKYISLNVNISKIPQEKGLN